MVSVLEFLKSIFYLKQLPLDLRSDIHPEATSLYQNDVEAFTEKAKTSVKESLDRLYDSPSSSSIKFTKAIPAHEKLRTTFLQQLDQDVRSSTIDNSQIHDMIFD